MKHKRQLNESGLVSFIVTMVLMIVVTLIVLGFSQIATREQRQALDRQLSTQAYYAAESGINDAINAINNNAVAADKTDCNNDASIGDPDLGNGISYSCLLIDLSPDTLEYSDVSTSQSTYARFRGRGADIRTVEIWWQAANDTITNFSSASPPSLFFPRVSTWQASGLTPVLRTTVTAITGYNRNNLDSNTYTAFLYPNTGGPSSLTAGGITTSGVIGQGGCNVGNTPKYCHVEIDLGVDAPEVFLQLKSIYGSSKVTVIARDSSDTLLEIEGAQSLIDATGRATDVLRRIQVRVPNDDSYARPESAAHSILGVCKLLNVIPGASGTSVAAGSPAICNP